jgi:hypothetical protein
VQGEKKNNKRSVVTARCCAMASPLINQSDPIASINLIHDELESFKKNVDIFFLVVMGSIVFCELN